MLSQDEKIDKTADNPMIQNCPQDIQRKITISQITSARSKEDADCFDITSAEFIFDSISLEEVERRRLRRLMAYMELLNKK